MISSLRIVVNSLLVISVASFSSHQYHPYQSPTQQKWNSLLGQTPLKRQQFYQTTKTITRRKANEDDDIMDMNISSCSGGINIKNRRSFLLKSSMVVATAASAIAILPPTTAFAKCTDIDSCRDIDDQKIEKDLKENPVIIFEDTGVRYKQLKPGLGESTVQAKNVVDLIYSISTGGGIYMYSQGFGYNKVDATGTGVFQNDDASLSSYRVRLGDGDLPIGIEQAIIGMKKGERRRIEVPPKVGFETSNWKPEPTTRNGKQRIKNYQTLLNGVGSTRPPFPAPTIWDVEILNFRE